MDEVAYVDAANLARRITCPVIVLVGFIDGACHPGSVYAAFNNIPGSQKTIVNEPNTDHTWNDAYSQSIARMIATLKQPESGE
ncbi:hypothetical protein SDC9_190050 [bioreactor metagenome]|uniref:Acetyl xylan esterase domain-containing protein n=1 Tax=bioreactor metagenome TaxID=1076179 RepID=A0A645I4T5_9ZZZZ